MIKIECACLVHGSLALGLGGALQWQPPHLKQIELESRDAIIFPMG